jgi:hypothetical protein
MEQVMKLSQKQLKALKDYLYAVAASAVTLGITTVNDMWPGYAVIVGALAAPAIKWANKHNKDYGMGSDK